MKFLIALTLLFATSASHACSIRLPHAPIEVGTVENQKVYSTTLGVVGELRGSEVYSYSQGLVGHLVGRKVEHANGSFAAFVAGGQILNINRQTAAVALDCTPARAGAAYLLLF